MNSDELDRLADEFEAAWSDGRRPRLGDFLQRVDSVRAMALAKLLLPVDIEYRMQAGEPVTPIEYQSVIEGGIELAQAALQASQFQLSHGDRDVVGPPHTPEQHSTAKGESDRDHQGLGDPNAASGLRRGLAPLSARARRIGPYKLLQKLGEGGMGEVWMAEQERPVRRRVAVKLIRGDRIDEKYILRFEAERQALAMMNHESIAKVFDVGTSDQGQPYFVMELVQGIPFTEYCDRNKLAIRERLELFIPVCRAIQHAHQKGIIHRDLKPTNVLVCLYDGRPVPKVIDFGLAKALEHTQRLTEKTMFTEFGQVVGSVQYMSPEQAEMNQLDIDTRTDIYSLGVMLYELLTGSTPIELETAKQQAILQVLATIREQDPPRPSMRLSSAALEAASGISAQRQIDPARLKQLLRGELDWIVMKALEKDRTRRYDTAIGLAKDIENYLVGEVVTARPPSTLYRCQKYIQRNKGLVVAVCGISLSLILGIIAAGWFAVMAEFARREADRKTTEVLVEKQRVENERERADSERKIAEQMRQAAQANEQLAKQNEELAYQERNVALAVRSFLQDSLLRQASVWEQAKRLSPTDRNKARHNITVRELLELAGQEYNPTNIAEKFPGQRVVQFEILETIAEAFAGVGQAEKAIEFLRGAIHLRQLEDPADPQLMRKRIDLIFTNLQASQHVAAVEDVIAMIDLLVSVAETPAASAVGTGSESGTNASRSQFAELASAVIAAIEDRLTLERQALPALRFGLRDSAVVILRVNQSARKLRRLSELAKEEFGANDRRTAFAELLWGFSLFATANTRGALAIFEDVNARAEGALPKHDLLLAGTKTILLTTLEILDEQPERILQLREEVYETLLEALGPDHPATLNSMTALAVDYYDGRQVEKAVVLYERTLDLMRIKFGPEHIDTTRMMNNLGLAYADINRQDEAIAMFEKVLESALPMMGPDDANMQTVMDNLAISYKAVGRLADAIVIYERLLQAKAAKHSPDHPDIRAIQTELASLYRRVEAFDKAIPLLESLLKSQEKSEGRPALATKLIVAQLGLCYKQAGRIDEAIPLLEEALTGELSTEDLRFMRAQLRAAYLSRDRREPLFDLVTKEVAAARDSLPADSLPLAAFLVAAGRDLLAQAHHQPARQLLTEGYRIRAQAAPEAWSTFNAQSLLGGAILAAAMSSATDETLQPCELAQVTLLQEAEPLLRDGYEGLQQRAGEIPAAAAHCLPEALERLVQLYTLWDRPEEVKKFRDLQTGLTTKTDIP